MLFHRMTESCQLLRFLSFDNASHVKGKLILKILTYEECLAHTSASVNSDELRMVGRHILLKQSDFFFATNN